MGTDWTNSFLLNGKEYIVRALETSTIQLFILLILGLFITAVFMLTPIGFYYRDFNRAGRKITKEQSKETDPESLRHTLHSSAFRNYNLNYRWSKFWTA